MLIAVAGVSSVLGVPSARAAPPNDDFASATVVPALPYTNTLDSTTATFESGEPQPCIASTRTVWYSFTVPASGLYQLDTFGSDFDTVLAVYTGSTLNSLSTVDCNDDTFSGLRSRIQFQAEAGVVYRVQAGGLNATGGTLVVNFAPAPPPPVNDNFSAAITVGALPFSDIRLNSAATGEKGELKTTCSDVEKTVWYTFTPTATAIYQIDTVGSDFDTVVTVYTGATLDTLVQVACNDDMSGGVTQSLIQTTLNAGTTYRIQVGGFSAFRGGAGADYGRIVFNVKDPAASGSDSDRDGCSDAQEKGADPNFGGDRDPLNGWDFFDVTADQSIGLTDTLLILAHFGHGPATDATDALLDRYAPDAAKPYRTAQAIATGTGINLADALLNLQSFGHSCANSSPAPTPTTIPATATATPTAAPTATVGPCIDTDADGICNSVDADDDNDGCTDVQEAGLDPNFGGDRDSLNRWDFYDVTGNKTINLDDTLDILSYFGDPGVSAAGDLRDRYIPDQAKPWRTAAANDGVGLTDVLANLRSFGHSCV